VFNISYKIHEDGRRMELAHYVLWWLWNHWCWTL